MISKVDRTSVSSDRIHKAFGMAIHSAPNSHAYKGWTGGVCRRGPRRDHLTPTSPETSRAVRACDSRIVDSVSGFPLSISSTKQSKR